MQQIQVLLLEISGMIFKKYFVPQVDEPVNEFIGMHGYDGWKGRELSGLICKLKKESNLNPGTEKPSIWKYSFPMTDGRINTASERSSDSQ